MGTRTEIERRRGARAELREAPRGSKDLGTLVGYAAVFNSPSELLNDKKSGRSHAFREIIRPGAFSRTLAGSDVRALVNHDPAMILGRSTAGTLRLTEDSRGLRCEIDLPDTTLGRDTAVSVKRGDISAMSFGFRIGPNGESWDLTGKEAVRYLSDIACDDVSLVAYPAYVDTSIGFRCVEGVVDPDAVARELARDRDRLRMAGAGCWGGSGPASYKELRQAAAAASEYRRAVEAAQLRAGDARARRNHADRLHALCGL